MILDGKNILITGGTGSFGKELVHQLITKYKRINKLIIFSRDELKQYEMSSEYPEKKYPNIRFFLGDIRDQERLNRALEDIDIVVHAAALKHVSAAEYNPFEFIKTNILGSQNIINACLNNNVKNVIALSTDKAVSPANLYGATKLCADKLFLSANNIKGKRKIKFTVVRYGNVFGSRGSVLPTFLKQRNRGIFKITSKEMTRFNILLKESAEMVIWAIKNNLGSEILIPKLKSYKVVDLAKAIDPNCKIEIIGIKQGEKIHEELITPNDSRNLVNIGNYYVYSDDNKIRNKYLSKFKNYKKPKKNFHYTSETNSDVLSVEDLKKLISNFQSI